MASTIAQHSIGHKNVEDDDVSLVSRRSIMSGSNCRGALFRVVLALIFIGLGIGALVYSVSRQSDSNDLNDDGGSSQKMQPFLNQWSDKGVFTVEKRKDDATNSTDESHQEYDTTTVTSQWYQDHTNRRLVHIIGDAEGSEYQYIYLILETNAYLTTIQQIASNASLTTCCQMSMNYTQYIAQFGLPTLSYMRKETVEINDQSYDVIKYSGEPSVSYEQASSTLTFGYLRQTDYTLLGWESYFNKPSNGSAASLYRIEYWFEDMKVGSPDPEKFHPPQNCGMCN